MGEIGLICVPVLSVVALAGVRVLPSNGNNSMAPNKRHQLSESGVDTYGGTVIIPALAL